jgi:hypothetical protein
MKSPWTMAHVKQLKAEGKIRGYKEQEPKSTPAGRKVGKHFKKAHPAKDWMAEQLLAWCQARGITLHEEYNFNPLRRWRADWCIPDLKILVEYEGLSAQKTGHTTSAGFTANTEKYNSAQSLGWVILRYTFMNYKDLIDDLNKHINH